MSRHNFGFKKPSTSSSLTCRSIQNLQRTGLDSLNPTLNLPWEAAEIELVLREFADGSREFQFRSSRYPAGLVYDEEKVVDGSQHCRSTCFAKHEW